MNKGTAIVGFFISFLAGMFLMWGIDRSGGMEISAETASAAGEADHSKAAIPISDDDPSWGSATAPVTIVEISDFECPYCGKVNPTLKALKAKYGPDKLRIVWKHNPLPFHKAARPAHEAAAAVMDLGGSEAFWKFHDKAFANRRDLNEENFKKWAKEAGIDEAKFAAALKDKKYAAKVDADLAVNRKIGATGTPAFRINGVEISGAQPEAKFTAVIDEQLAEAKKLIDSGTAAAEVYPILVAKNAKTGGKEAEEREAPPPDTTVWAVPVMDDDPRKGGKEPLVTIVEFSEFQCPFCKRVGPTIKQILDKYKDDVQIVWKDNPLGFHPRAAPAANAARAVYKAKGDAAFWEAHDKLFESQPKLADEDIVSALDGLGVPAAVLKQAIATNQYGEKFDQSSEIAQDFEARGTPHFFVNGLRVKGAQPFSEFEKVIDEQIKKAKAMVAKGTPRSKIYEEIMKEGKSPPAPEKKELGPAPADSPQKGNRNAKIIIQEFSDFQCPFCGRVNPTLKEVLDKHDDVKIVWRNMPLPFHKDAPLAAEAAFEVYKQKGDDAFWKYHDKLFAGQKDPGVQRPQLEQYAQEIGGIDMAKFKKALDDRTHKARIEADVEAGKKAGINGTPGFVINGYFVSGAQQYGAFKKAITLAKKEL